MNGISGQGLDIEYKAGGQSQKRGHGHEKEWGALPSRRKSELWEVTYDVQERAKSHV